MDEAETRRRLIDQKLGLTGLLPPDSIATTAVYTPLRPEDLARKMEQLASNV